jgi:hypothetical protein
MSAPSPVPDMLSDASAYIDGRQQAALDRRFD